MPPDPHLRRDHTRSTIRSAVRFSLLLLVALFGAGGVAAADPVVRLDRSQVVEGDPVVLTLAVSGDVGGSPDFSALQQNFDLLSQGQSNRMSFVNGRSSSSREWHLTLMPRAPGKIVIPAIPVGNTASAPVTLEVLPASEAAKQGVARPVMVEAEVDNDAPFVQQQIVYRVRLLYAVPLRGANLSDPVVENALVQRLGSEIRSETYREGRQYRVVERRYAILPQSSGPLTIEGPVLTARVAETSQQRGNNLRDRFFGADPFSGPGGLFGQTRPVQARAADVSLDVRAQPVGASSPWLPAQSLTLNEVWSPDPPQFRVGEPTTRTLVITAQGLADEQLPTPTLDPGSGMQVYPDRVQAETRPSDDTLVAQKVVKVALVPATSGPMRLPEIAVRWWDVDEGVEKVARIAARDVDVLAGSGGAMSGTAPSNTAARTLPDRATVSPAPTAASPRPTSDLGPAGDSNLWPWIAGLFALAWLVVTGMWLRARTAKAMPAARPASPATTLAAAPASHADLTAVRHAFSSHDAQQARTALLQWAAATWPDAAPRGLDALAASLGPGAIEPLRDIDSQLYAQRSDAWNGNDAWRRLEPLLRPVDAQRRRSDKQRGTALPPLYPNAG